MKKKKRGGVKAEHEVHLSFLFYLALYRALLDFGIVVSWLQTINYLVPKVCVPLQLRPSRPLPERYMPCGGLVMMCVVNNTGGVSQQVDIIMSSNMIAT